MTDNCVVVHPLVLLSVVDHYRRVDSERVVGVLLGTDDNEVHITNSFAVPFEEDNEGNWFFDTSYQQNMYDLFRKVNSNEKILGWYHSGPKMYENDLEITKSFLRTVENPLMAIIDVKMDGVDLPVQVFKLEKDESNGKNEKTFVHVTSKVEAEEAEEVGVEHLIRDIKDETVGYSFNKVKEIYDSLKIYKNNLLVIEKYLEDVIENRKEANHNVVCFLQECLNDVPKVEDGEEEHAMGCYTSSLTKAVVLLNDLIKNRSEKIETK